MYSLKNPKANLADYGIKNANEHWNLSSEELERRFNQLQNEGVRRSLFQ